MRNELTESLEKYLLAIYELLQVKENIKVKDVSCYLKIGGPSTSDAIKTLCERGFINYVPYGVITLTNKGQDAINIKLYRHGAISDFLNQVLGISKDEADKNAENIEYSMTEDVLEKFVHFLDFMKQCSCKEPKWMKSCKHRLENGEISKKCASCMEDKNAAGCKDCCGGH